MLFPSAGFPYEILASSHYVPGTERHELPRYWGKEVWATIMVVSEKSSNLYCLRVINMFDSQVGPEAPVKAKARLV